MNLPLSAHQYGAHPVVLPPGRADRHEQAPIAPDVRLAIYRKLQEMRQFEKRAYDLFMRQLVKGTSRLSLGMEAISAGFGAAMRGDDYTFRDLPGAGARPRSQRADDPENNLYMEYTSIADITAVPHPGADRAAAYDSRHRSSTATTRTSAI